MNVRLYVWQRLTAAAMAPMLLLHLAVIFYATRKGLSAADMLARTRGSVSWALFYGVFVSAVAVHAAIGVRTVLSEWLPLRARHADVAAVLFGVLLAVLGFRAVAAVVLPVVLP
jgi:fumarate reductase subunit C